MRVDSAHWRGVLLLGICALAPLLSGSRDRGDATRRPRRSPHSVEVPGATLEFPSRPVYGPGERLDRHADTAREIKAILAATAVLRTTRELRYRSSVLPPGTYRVSVVRGRAEKFYLVIGPPRDEPPSSAEGRDLRMGVAGDILAGGGDREDGGRGRGAPARTSGKSDRAKSSRKRKESPRIRAIFRLMKSRRPTRDVVFGLRAFGGKERKLELSIYAGTSSGQVNLSLATATDARARKRSRRR